MNGGPSGFQNAPVTRTFVIASALLTILFGVQGWSHRLGLSYQDIFEKFQLWRVIGSVFAFSSTLELIFGLFLLYYFRVFERQIGSNKHSVFISFSVITSLLLEVVALSFLKDSSLSTLASGAYGLIFASFMPFYYDIPVSSQFPVFRINFTDKSFIYLAGLQLVLLSWKHSLIPSVCGLLAGALYRLNIFGIRKIKFPKAVASLFSCLSWPSSGSSPHTPSRRNIIRNVPSYVGHQMQGNYPSAAARTAVPEPPESSIAMLVSMGFDSNSARRALMQARNDINAATNILLETQSR